VGGQPNSRGVVATCSYEARKYGIHSAMPSSQAFRACPQAIFVKPRFEAYRRVSEQIRSIFRQYTDQVEPVSLDEAYLDVTLVTDFKGSATLLAQDIKTQIKHHTELTASAGISYNKFLAKIASDINKPDGLFLITPEQSAEFIAKLPVGKFHGIGKATEAKMLDLGLHTGADLKACSAIYLQQYFGKSGVYYHNIAHGIDLRRVTNNRTRKSVGVETTFQQDLNDPDIILEYLEQLLLKALTNVQNKNLSARTLTIKIKYEDFEQITRSRTLLTPVNDDLATLNVLRDLVNKSEAGVRKIRLLGVSLSSLQSSVDAPEYQQMDIFSS
jgi:DNA polymerase-4